MKLVKLLLHHGCNLSNFDSTPNFQGPPQIFPDCCSTMNIPPMSHLYSILETYNDPRLATEIARLLYDAGAPLNPTSPHGMADLQVTRTNERGGCELLRRIARKFEFSQEAQREQPEDAEKIGWLLYAASEPRSLQECAIGAVRRALEYDIPHKLEQLHDRLPPPLIIAVRKDSRFELSQNKPSSSPTDSPCLSYCNANLL